MQAFRVNSRTSPWFVSAALLMGVAASASAQFPAQDMDGRSLGFGYNFALRGQGITDAEVSGNEVIHQALLGYSPVKYVVAQVGLGIDRFSVEPHSQSHFQGDYGFSPSFGLSLYSPFFALDLLRATGGVAWQSFSSEDGRGYRYSGSTRNPFLGLLLSPTVFLDIGIGGRMHLVDGNMEGPGTGEIAFANSEIFRGYAAITLKTPFERSFLHMDFDFSPAIDADWSDGPREATLSLSVGAILGWKGRSTQRDTTEKPVYFPAYPELKERQKKMAEELE